MSDLSVIVVSWNTSDLLAACLESVLRYAPPISTDVWTVDNASTDDSAEMVRRRFPTVNFIGNATNVGFAAANNQAIRASEGRYLLLLNSDAIVQPDSLQQMFRFMDEHPNAGVCGAKLVNLDGTFQASYARFPSVLSEALLLTGLARATLGPWAPSPRPQPGEGARAVDWVAGAGLMARRSAIAQVGLMDEGYFLYGEETDWCWRFRLAGWEVWYLPTAIIQHVGGASARQRSATSYSQLFASKVRFFERSYGSAAARRLRAMLTLLAAARLGVWRLLEAVRFDKGQREHARHRRLQETDLLRQGLPACFGKGPLC